MEILINKLKELDIQARARANKVFLATYTRRENMPDTDHDRGGYNDSFYRTTRFEDFTDLQLNNSLPEYNKPETFHLKSNWIPHNLCNICRTTLIDLYICPYCNLRNNELIRLMISDREEFIKNSPPEVISIDHCIWDEDEDLQEVTTHLDLLHYS
jgi:hypothetical protein